MRIFLESLADNSSLQSKSRRLIAFRLIEVLPSRHQSPDQGKECEKTIKTQTKGNATVQRLKTTPGIGEFFARPIDAEIDDIARFRSRPSLRPTAHPPGKLGRPFAFYIQSYMCSTAMEHCRLFTAKNESDRTLPGWVRLSQRSIEMYPSILSNNRLNSAALSR
jgi:hypothetical protein